jgi:RNA polymerase sigma-70 factor (ECF subfamily)
METRALFESHFPTLFRYCLRLTGEPDVAEDAAQEAFVRLVRDDVRGSPTALRAWLFRVASNVIRDRYRVRENRRRLMETHPTTPEMALDPYESVERGEEVARVRAILDQLPERDRILLLMREEGFAYAEIAEQIGVAPTSIGTLLARAQCRFAEAFTRSDGAQNQGDSTS